MGDNLNKAIAPSMRAPTRKERRYDAMNEWFDPNTQILGRANTILDLLPALLRPSVDPGEAMFGAIPMASRLKIAQAAAGKPYAGMMDNLKQPALNLGLESPMELGPSLAGKELKYTPKQVVEEALPQQLGLNSVFDPFEKIAANIKTGVGDLASKLKKFDLEQMIKNPFRGVDVEAAVTKSNNPFAGMFDDAGNLVKKSNPLANATAPKVAKAAEAQAAKVAQKMSKLKKVGLGLTGAGIAGAGMIGMMGDKAPKANPTTAPTGSGGMRQPVQASPTQAPPDINTLIEALAPKQQEPVKTMEQRLPLFPPNEPMGGKKTNGFDWKTLLQIAGPLLAAIIATRN